MRLSKISSKAIYVACTIIATGAITCGIAYAQNTNNSDDVQTSSVISSNSISEEATMQTQKGFSLYTESIPESVSNSETSSQISNSQEQNSVSTSSSSNSSLSSSEVSSNDITSSSNQDDSSSNGSSQTIIYKDPPKLPDIAMPHGDSVGIEKNPLWKYH